MGKVKIKAEDLNKRISFLYQAAHLCLETSKDVSMCRYYTNLLQTIARKNQILLHPDVKRTICKRCCCLLVPGKTSISRVKRKAQKQTVVTCLECGMLRRFVYNPKMQPRIDQSENWEDVVVNGQLVAVAKHSKEGKQHHLGEQKSNIGKT